MAMHLEFAVLGPPISNQQSTPQGKANLAAWRATVDGNVLASAKSSPSEMQADPNLSTYAKAIEKQPGWRYDVFVVGPDAEATPEKGDVKAQSEEEIRRSLDDAERMLRASFVAPSVIAAWAALESAMRRARPRDAGLHFSGTGRRRIRQG
jgi:hypothetical protein